MKKKPLSKRATARLQKLRRDPFGRFGLALQAYLATIGWSAILVDSPAIRGIKTRGPVGHFLFEVTFMGGKTITSPNPVGPQKARR